MPELKKRAVAGSFIFKFPDGDVTATPKIALFRRSGEVRTYQHKYAPISGSVEEDDANPLATAWRELREETTLTGNSLRLFRQGKPYSFVDESVGREWAINPFGFVLLPASEGGAGEAGIRLDWEHEGYEWFDPDQVNESEDFQGVPRILESLRRVWFDIDIGPEAGQALSRGLVALQSDHESGARQLASKALDIFADVIPRLDTGDRDAWWKNVRFAGWHLWKNGRESMGAPILSVVLSSLAIIERSLPSGRLSSAYVDDVVAALEDYSTKRQEASTKIGQSFSSFTKKHFAGSDPLKIVTLSSSSTITSCITHALEQGHRPLDIRILESRPLFEGAKMAMDIAAAATEHNANETKVTVYTDAGAAVAAQDADIILLGADLINKAGDVSNKTGSLPAVLSARHVSPTVKVVVLADKEKVLPFEPPGHEDNDARELTRSWADAAQELSASGIDVGVRNVYFEWVPASMVDHYVTEDGTVSREGIAEWADVVKQRADGFFSTL